MIELQPRDMELLKILNKFGALDVRGLKNIYSDYYYKHRLLKLKKENYVIGKHGFVILGYKGKETLEELNIEIRPSVYDKSKARKLSKTAGIYTELSNWELKNSQTVKKERTLNQVCQICGSITNDRKEEFLTYYLSNGINKQRLTYALYEIKSLNVNTCSRIIIFINSSKVMQQIPINPLNRYNLLLVPVGKSSIELLNEYGAKDINWGILNQLPNVKKSTNSLFEFEDEDNYYTSLALIDIAKIEHLNNFAKNFTHINKKINLFCLCGMEEYFKANLHEKINLIPIDYSKLS